MFDQRARAFFGQLLTFGLATRIAVLAIGILCPQRAENLLKLPQYQAYFVALTQTWRHWFEPWYRWDALWYLDIAFKGYEYNGDPTQYSSVAFMPLLPSAIALLAKIGIDPYLAGLIIPNLAFAIGLAVFGLITEKLTGSQETAWRSCFLLCAFPTAFFFSAPYQESLSFLFTSIALYAWIYANGRVSAISLAIAALARQATVAVSLAFVVEWFFDLIKQRRPKNAAWLVVAATFIAVGLFAGFLYLKFGDPTISAKAQAAWQRDSPSVLNILKTLITLPIGEHKSISYLLDYSIMILMLILSAHAYRVRGVFWASAIVFPIVLAMSTGTALSMKRFALSSFPAFVDAGELLSKRWLFWIAIAIGVSLQIFQIYWYVNWGFSKTI